MVFNFLREICESRLLASGGVAQDKKASLFRNSGFCIWLAIDCWRSKQRRKTWECLSETLPDHAIPILATHSMVDLQGCRTSYSKGTLALVPLV